MKTDGVKIQKIAFLYGAVYYPIQVGILFDYKKKIKIK